MKIKLRMAATLELRKKFKDIPENIIESILKLSLEKIEKINGDLFDIESTEELKKYF